MKSLRKVGGSLPPVIEGNVECPRRYSFLLTSPISRVRWAVSLSRSTNAELTLLTVNNSDDIQIVESGARVIERPEASDRIIFMLAAQLKDQLEREVE